MSGEPEIVVVGAGAFGTALAAVMAREGKSKVTLLARDAELVNKLEKTHVHDASLPGISLPQSLQYSATPEVLKSASIVLFAMPAQAQREAAMHLASNLKPSAFVVICAKGIEQSSGKLLTDVLQEELPNQKIAILSGPGFAADIASGLPTAMVIAAHQLSDAADLAEALSGETFRLYPSNDRVGVQLGGALKNVLAIACGVVEGAGLGDSARAALISRGLAEMSRFVVAEGGKAETLQGLSGLGDLVLTATSHQSRNLRYGIALGQGRADETTGYLVEGAYTASASARLADEFGIELPITNAVAAIIDGRTSVAEAIKGLMTRPIKQE